MIDTLKISYYTKMKKRNYRSWSLEKKQRKGWTQYRYSHTFYVGNDQVPVKAIYQPISYKGKPLLQLEFSLARAVYGNNIPMFFDLEVAAARANELISGIIPDLDIDFAEGELTRLDIFYNHFVGRDIRFYLIFLSGQNYPRRKTKTYKGESVVFESNTIDSIFYDKYLESNQVEAKGILRQEVKLKYKPVVKKYLGIKKPFLSDITQKMVENILKTDVVRLKIDDIKLVSKATGAHKLIEAYGYRKGIFLFGLQNLLPKLPVSEILDMSQITERTLNNWKNSIYETGIPQHLIDTGIELPSLKIAFDEDLISKNEELFPKVLTIR